jgi:hypothetical protein
LKKHYTSLGRRSALTPSSSQFGTFKSDNNNNDDDDDDSTTEYEEDSAEKRPDIRNKAANLKGPYHITTDRPPNPTTFGNTHTRPAPIFTASHPNPNPVGLNSAGSGKEAPSSLLFTPAPLSAPTPASSRSAPGPGFFQVHPSGNTADHDHPEPAQKGPGFFKSVPATASKAGSHEHGNDDAAATKPDPPFTMTSTP